MPKANPRTADDDDDTDAPVTQADELEESLLTEFQAGGDDVSFSIRVFKVSDAGRAGDPEEYLFAIDSVELPNLWDRLRDEQGTGIYRAHVYKTQNGRKNKYRQFDMRIRAPNKKPVEAKAPDSASLIEAIQRSNEAMFNRFDTMLKERASPVAAVDPITMFEKAVTIIAAIKTPAPVQQAPAMSPEAIFNLVNQGIEVGRSITNGGADDASFMGIVKEIFRQPAVGEAIGNAATNFLNRNASPGAAAPPQQLQQPTAQDMARIQLTNALNYLSTKAAANKPIPLYVDWFMDEIPPDTLTQLLGMPDLLDQLSTNHPGVAANREWFSKFLDDLRGMMQPPPSPDHDADEGDGTHARSTDGAA